MILSFALGLISIIFCSLFTHLHYSTIAVIGWNIGAITYLIICFGLINSGNDKILEKAKAHDENEWIILFVSSIASISSFIAIVFELSATKSMKGFLAIEHIGLSALTIATSWLFIHTAFALHYAHEYFSKPIYKQKPFLIFPDTKEPNYWDFMYFSFVIGTSGQTADVSFGNNYARRIGFVHCILAYFFNAAILALMINISASLIS